MSCTCCECGTRQKVYEHEIEATDSYTWMNIIVSDLVIRDIELRFAVHLWRIGRAVCARPEDVSATEGPPDVRASGSAVINLQQISFWKWAIWADGSWILGADRDGNWLHPLQAPALFSLHAKQGLAIIPLSCARTGLQSRICFDGVGVRVAVGGPGASGSRVARQKREGGRGKGGVGGMRKGWLT